MKKFIKFGIILFISSLFIFGCAKENSPKNTKISNKELLSILPEDFYKPSTNAKNVTSRDDILELTESTDFIEDLSYNCLFAISSLLYEDDALEETIQSVLSDIESAISNAEKNGKFTYSLDMKDKDFGNENSVILNVNSLKGNLKSANVEKEDIKAEVSANIEATLNGAGLPRIENQSYWYNDDEENSIKAIKAKVALNAKGAGDLSLDDVDGNVKANIGLGILFDTGDYNGMLNINLGASSENLSNLVDSVEVFFYKLEDLVYECDSEEESIDKKIAAKADKLPIELNLSYTFTDVNGKNPFECINITKPSDLLEQTNWVQNYFFSQQMLK